MNLTQKISQMTPKGADLDATDLIEVSTIVGGSYVTKSITGQELIDAIPPTTIEWGDIGGTLSDQTDLNTALNGKVPTTRTLTINGVAQDLSADRSWTISTGLTVGTTPISSGTNGRVLFQGTGNVLQQSSSLFWDNTNGRLGIGTSSPTRALEVLKSGLVDNSVEGIQISVTHQSALAQAALEFKHTNFDALCRISTTVGNGGANPSMSFFIRNIRSYTIFQTGNVAINTTTDAGFKLDVNGTARVSGNLTFGFNTTYITTSSTGGGINAGINTFFNNGAVWIDDTSVRALDITYNNGIKIANTTRYPLSLGTSSKAVASAQLEMVSTTQGFLPPRMTTTQKNAIASPATGLQVYDATLNRPCFYDGTTWITL